MIFYYYEICYIKYSGKGFVGTLYYFSTFYDYKLFQNKFYFYKEHLDNDLWMSS